ncbi:DUF2268 domain-containing putative Zn-dependent protease [Pedobacter heparinus]|uniref:gliding motility protein GldB-related protein n=1 Tax=Pedobacter heparinus TaxID=984 RepID=UPI00292E63CE|nr:DUF2268 domain-containing putative Zn-dependent protease [Pedobacter heparinus]
MNKTWLVVLYFSILPYVSVAQSVSDPLKAEFVTKDIPNFWIAFDSLQAGYKGNPFNDFYISKGSPGIAAFMKSRIINADSLRNRVSRNKTKYLEKRESSLQFLNHKKQCISTYMALKYLYPDAVFPPVYFVIGRFNSGGHSHKNGLVIGAEMNEPNNVPYTVAHELIHYQQQDIQESETNLLSACIAEGSADFIAELISGGGPNAKTYAYGNTNEKKLWTEFKTIMYDKDNNHDWIYSYKPKNGYPPDLGYWMGYKITEAYYKKSTDKKKAIADILHIKDYRKFLKDSAYEERFK